VDTWYSFVHTYLHGTYTRIHSRYVLSWSNIEVKYMYRVCYVPTHVQTHTDMYVVGIPQIDSSNIVMVSAFYSAEYTYGMNIIKDVQLYSCLKLTRLQWQVEKYVLFICHWADLGRGTYHLIPYCHLFNKWKQVWSTVHACAQIVSGTMMLHLFHVLLHTP
jgi:hypothetical protein